MKKLISMIVRRLLTLQAGEQEIGLTLAPLFTDHAILQQGQSIPVWGMAAPKVNVTVTYGLPAFPFVLTTK